MVSTKVGLHQTAETQCCSQSMLPICCYTDDVMVMLYKWPCSGRAVHFVITCSTQLIHILITWCCYSRDFQTTMTKVNRIQQIIKLALYLWYGCPYPSMGTDLTTCSEIFRVHTFQHNVCRTAVIEMLTKRLLGCDSAFSTSTSYCKQLGVRVTVLIHSIDF